MSIPLPHVLDRLVPLRALTVEAYARVINPKGFQDPEDLVELPCSWLAARAFYAGRTPLGLTHVPEVVKLVQDLT